MTGTSDHSAALDSLMRDVVAESASLIARDPARPSLRESLIEEALIFAWNRRSGGGSAARAQSLPVPDWFPQPRHTDFAAARPGERFPSVAAEVKIDDLDQTLWDVFKLLSVARGTTSLKRTYLIVAGYPSRWTNVQCSELYDSRTATRVWDSATMFARWRKAWEDLLQGGTGRPKRVHAGVSTSFIWGGPVPAFAKDRYQLRCIAVAPAADDAWLAFDGDWPRA